MQHSICYLEVFAEESDRDRRLLTVVTTRDEKISAFSQSSVGLVTFQHWPDAWVCVLHGGYATLRLVNLVWGSRFNSPTQIEFDLKFLMNIWSSNLSYSASNTTSNTTTCPTYYISPRDQRLRRSKVKVPPECRTSPRCNHLFLGPWSTFLQHFVKTRKRLFTLFC